MTFKEYIEKHNISTDVTELNCSSKGLTNLIGIENLTDLEVLNCYNNQIIDLKPIDKLKKLRLLRSDITSDIEEARRLILPEIRRNKISDII